MISPNFFKNENNLQRQEKQNMLGSFVDLVVRNIRSTLDNLAKNNIFRVKVEKSEDSQLLREIADKLYSLVEYSKISNGSKLSQKISVKTTDLVTVNKEIENLLRKIEAKELKVNIPELSKIVGNVAVTNFPTEFDFSVIYDALVDVQRAIKQIKLVVPPQREIKFPEIKFPEPTSPMIEGKQIVELLKVLTVEIKSLPSKMPITQMPTGMKVHVENFPPQKYPMPVTHMSINSLNGFAKSRAVTVTSTLTPLPAEVLSYRRALTIYNNSSQTVYIGGSDVTVSNGLPIPAGTYSPAIDAGSRMIIYGIVSSATSDIRILEVSDENSGR